MSRYKSIALYWGIRDYLKQCQCKPVAPKTLRWYEQKLTAFRVYMAKVHHVASVGSMTYQHVEAFLASLQGDSEAVSDATVKGYIQVLKGFFKWAEAQGYTRYNPVKLAEKRWVSHKQNRSGL